MTCGGLSVGRSTDFHRIALLMHATGFYRALIAVAILLGIGLCRPAAHGGIPGALPVEPARLTSRREELRPALRESPPTAAGSIRRHPAISRVTAQSRPDYSRARVVLVVGAVAFCGALLLRSQLARRSGPDIQRTADRATGIRTSLDALISNSLPVVEEALPLPQQSQIFGRPLLESPFRVDAAEALNGPHFPIKLVRPEGQPPPAQADARPSPATGTGRQTRVDGAHSPASLGALDRALAAIEEEKR